jgi:hypothetical protein
VLDRCSNLFVFSNTTATDRGYKKKRQGERGSGGTAYKNQSVDSPEEEDSMQVLQLLIIDLILRPFARLESFVHGI